MLQNIRKHFQRLQTSPGVSTQHGRNENLFRRGSIIGAGLRPLATVLMHADTGQVHNLLIKCTLCGSYNSTDG